VTHILEDTAEDLFEDAPCGYLSTTPDGTILRVNRTFEEWTGLRRGDLVGLRRFQDLLTKGGQIYHETHFAPLLRMQGEVREIAVEIVRADGSRLPALVNSVLHADRHGVPRSIRTTVFDATDRRSYERELLRSRQHEHELGLLLQRSLLGGELPGGEDAEVGFTYLPAVRGQEAGGDWYDAFPAGDGHELTVVVGDVVGRGIGAAATMGQLRSAARALVLTGLGPAEVLGGLDRYCARHDVGEMATVVHAQVDLRDGRMRYACAGHLPPVLVEPGRPPRYLQEGRSLPLGVQPEGEARRDAVAELVPGAVLVLYTDGLVERSDRPLEEGLAGLLSALEELGDLPPGELTERVAARLVDRDAPSDDVCVLALRRRR
jgi:PAS domain S-box-containing protein